MQAHVKVKGTLKGVDNTAERGAMPDLQRSEGMQAHASLSGSSRGKGKAVQGRKEARAGQERTWAS